MIRKAVILAAVAALAGCQQDGNDSGASSDRMNDRTTQREGSDRISSGGGGSGARMSNRQLSQADRQFLTDAASGGMYEVQSSELAALRGTDPEKTFAKMMIDDHTRVNNDLMQLARDKGMNVPKEMQPKHKKMLDELQGVKGNEFISQYHRQQVQAHDEAIQLFQTAARSAQDPDVKAFAADTLPKLQEHRRHLDQHQH